MERLTLDLVMAAVNRLALHYPNSGHSKSSLRAIAEDWLSDFTAAGIRPERFASMVIMARRRGRFFPTIAEMMDYHRELVSIDVRNKEARMFLPEPPTTEEERRMVMANFRKIIEIAQSGLSPDGMAAEMDAFIARGSR